MVQKIAILGGGNMARALIGGLLSRGTPAAALAVGEPSAAARAGIAGEFGVAASADNAAVVASADLVVLAVKPQDARAALAPLRAALERDRPLLLSVAAGIRTASLRAWCGPDVPIARAMPNRPALASAGATGLFAPDDVGAAHRRGAEEIMAVVGEVVWVPTEDALDVVTALSGSGPAYCFLLAELMMQAAIELGLEPQAARRLAIATLHGSGVLARASDGDLARLRAEVTSRGGTTEAALRELAAADLAGIVRRALGAATARSRELAARFGAGD